MTRLEAQKELGSIQKAMGRARTPGILRQLSNRAAQLHSIIRFSW